MTNHPPIPPYPIPNTQHPAPNTQYLFWGYLLLVAAAELLTSLVKPQIGLLLHALILGLLLLHSALATRDDDRKLVLALTLAPLIRLLSLSLPLTRFAQVAWYPIVAVPLLLAAWLIIRQVGVGRRALGLRGGNLPLQLMLMGGGLGLGAVEYGILRPAPLLPAFSWGAFALASLSLLIFTGFSEELIFRGLLQTVAWPLLGRWTIFYVSLLFAVLHIGYLSVVDVLFVFAVGWLFAYIVRWDGSILGVTLAHGLTNITLFLIMPFLATTRLAIARDLLWATIWGGTAISLIATGLLARRAVAERRALQAAPEGAAVPTGRRTFLPPPAGGTLVRSNAAFAALLLAVEGAGIAVVRLGAPALWSTVGSQTVLRWSLVALLCIAAGGCVFQLLAAYVRLVGSARGARRPWLPALVFGCILIAGGTAAFLLARRLAPAWWAAWDGRSIAGWSLIVLLWMALGAAVFYLVTIYRRMLIESPAHEADQHRRWFPVVVVTIMLFMASIAGILIMRFSYPVITG